ncbi:hypothetical protein GWO43_04210, partial [candidate division KSB1 bacterium]|nr:hypothetical protein [candidate division KSB1 bacterium]NIW68181.1 hypothetical protein [candidate division KSB1 bacterium]NIX69784.1 hypothetical protein [candidate division KSB1 bacterium]
TLTGTTTANTDTVSAFLLDSSNNQTSFEGSVTSGSFEIYVRFPAEGTFKLGVLPGIEGQSIVKEIKVLSNSCIAEAEDGSIAPTSFIELDL